MKVIHQSISLNFLQNTAKLTTNKTEFSQSPNTAILGKVDPPPFMFLVSFFVDAINVSPLRQKVKTIIPPTAIK